MLKALEQKLNVMAHRNARAEKWRGKRRMEGVASSRALYRTLIYGIGHGLSSITTADAHTSAASSRLNWHPADINGLVCFAGKPNLVSARVPSRSVSALPSSLLCVAPHSTPTHIHCSNWPTYSNVFIPCSVVISTGTMLRTTAVFPNFSFVDSFWLRKINTDLTFLFM